MKFKNICLLICMALAISACHAPAAEKEVTKNIQQSTPAASEEKKELPESKPEAILEKISAEEAYQMMSEEGVIIVDVRTPEEYADGHIPKALLLPLDSIEAEAENKLPDKNAKLLVYCRSGRRSAVASEALHALGYQAVYDFGGITRWPYEIEK